MTKQQRDRIFKERPVLWVGLILLGLVLMAVPSGIALAETLVYFAGGR